MQNIAVSYKIIDCLLGEEIVTLYFLENKVMNDTVAVAARKFLVNQ